VSGRWKVLSPNKYSTKGVACPSQLPHCNLTSLTFHWVAKCQTLAALMRRWPRPKIPTCTSRGGYRGRCRGSCVSVLLGPGNCLSGSTAKTLTRARTTQSRRGDDDRVMGLIDMEGRPFGCVVCLVCKNLRVKRRVMLDYLLNYCFSSCFWVLVAAVVVVLAYALLRVFGSRERVRERERELNMYIRVSFQYLKSGAGRALLHDEKNVVSSRLFTEICIFRSLL